MAEDVQVTRHGAFIGWKVIALAAVAFLGVYASNVIAPVLSKLDATHTAVERHDQRLADLERSLNRYAVEAAAISEQVKSLRNDVNRIERNR
jgi:septal ring factor EnvC (AmiA/AmiB activator)